MRKARTTTSQIDLTVPLEVKHATETNDCIGGSEYDPQDKDCSICADIELCGIRHQLLLQSKKNAFEMTNGPTLDMTDFKSVDLKKIEKLCQKYEAEGSDPISFDELCEFIETMARTKDREAVVQYIKRVLPTTNLILKGGFVAWKE